MFKISKFYFKFDYLNYIIKNLISIPNKISYIHIDIA